MTGVPWRTGRDRSRRGATAPGLLSRQRGNKLSEMSTTYPHNVVLTEQAAAALREDFLGWQCRVRALSARQAGGRPMAGMRPRVLTPLGDQLSPAIIVLIVEEDPADSTTLFRHQYLKTNDPIERYEKIVEILAAGYFQHPENFSDVMTALFGPESTIAAALLNHGACALEFEAYAQAYRIPCKVLELATDDSFFQATYWHNRMFNPNMPPGVRVLSFAPDWVHAAGWRVEDE